MDVAGTLSIGELLWTESVASRYLPENTDNSKETTLHHVPLSNPKL